MKRIFVTHIAPKNKVLEYKVSVAACNFSYNLIGGGFDKVYSILPTYVLGNKVFPQDGEIDYIYSSWRSRSKLLCKLAPIKENILLFKEIEINSSVWFYNITMLNVWLILLLRLFKPSVHINVIVLDFTPGAKYNNFFLRQINKCHGRILLANSSLFNKTNAIVLPGVTPSEKCEYPMVTEIKKEFLISGVLSENIAMLPMLLSAFSKLPECILHVTGIVEDDALVKKYAQQYSNIVYHGHLPFDEYLYLLDNTPFLLSTRNPIFPENQCNFPSKIIEALLHNRIVVSTLHYDQLDGVRYLEIPSDEDGFIKMIMNIVQRTDDELLSYANQSEMVSRMFSVNVWNKTMHKIENF